MSEFKPILDSNYVDTKRFDNVPLGNINDLPNYELTPQKCFLGAWYRKVVSPKDYWMGIEGEIELGEFIADKERYNLDGSFRNMDNPNVYMGGCADFESDCGIGYNTTYPDGDLSYEMKSSGPRLGYRPFWRYIYKVKEISKNTTEVKNVNSWNNTDPKQLCYYYFPGDIIRMKVYSPLPNYLQLRIELVKPTTIEKYVKIRQSYNLENNLPSNFYSPLFHSEGQGIKICEFKRVNSIDQFGNEGFIAKATKARISTATWYNCYLYKEKEGKIYKYPFVESLRMDLQCPNSTAMTVEEFNKELGGEKISIHPETYKK